VSVEDIKKREATSKGIVLAALHAVKLDGIAKEVANWWRRRARDRYVRHLIQVYEHPLSRTYESFDQDGGIHNEIFHRAKQAFEGDRAWVSDLMAKLPERPSSEERTRVVRSILDRVIDEDRIPRYYDYDYLDDLPGIIGSRYQQPNSVKDTAEWFFECLATMLDHPTAHPAAVARATKDLLGPDHPYAPRRGRVTSYVKEVIPDLVDEFVALKAEDNVARFLEINREYSRRQFQQKGLWDNRELSLLREHEYDHHLLLRTLVGLKRDDLLRPGDEVLVVGPRHIDEIRFFRKRLGLSKSIGLDLFGTDDGAIVGGDMHDMPFQSGRFKLVFCAGTLSYAYYSRKVIEEIARVTTRPGYVFLMDAANRVEGPDPLGRSDNVNIDAMIGLFHNHKLQILARDRGKSLAPHMYTDNPCLAIQLD
jgi:hypothetical protein